MKLGYLSYRFSLAPIHSMKFFARYNFSLNWHFFHPPRWDCSWCLSDFRGEGWLKVIYKLFKGSLNAA